MQPLIDGDVILYEIGFAAESGWQGEGVPPFDYVADLLNMRIGNLCAIIPASRQPIFYFTGKTNFRTDIAKKRLYKERASNKPFHYYNLKAYIKGNWEWHEQEGLEADDLMSIEQTRARASLFVEQTGGPLPVETIICTRDKDLRQVPGWHYGWELGNQPQFGPSLVDELGYLTLEKHVSPTNGLTTNKLRGTGALFFYGQCLVGDSVDTVPGLPRCGPVKAFKMLAEAETSSEAFKVVLEAYRGVYGDDAEEQLLEQGRLLWMTRELNPDGTPVLWKLPDGNTENTEQ